ncbi:hypothetical protein APHAL10511_002865 [Amanita phalloides]|nr:hypothetical protein APHAL10511_002865 [Amanita phalloides]
MIDIFGWLNEMHRVKSPQLTHLQSLIVYNSCLPQGENAFDEIFDFIAWRGIRIEGTGFIVEKLQNFGFGGCWDSDEADEDVDVVGQLRVQLRKLCGLHDVQFSVNRDRFEIEGSHDRSSDPYVYSSFSSDDPYESSDEWSGEVTYRTMPVFE